MTMSMRAVPSRRRRRRTGATTERGVRSRRRRLRARRGARHVDRALDRGFGRSTPRCGGDDVSRPHVLHARDGDGFVNGQSVSGDYRWGVSEMDGLLLGLKITRCPRTRRSSPGARGRRKTPCYFRRLRRTSRPALSRRRARRCRAGRLPCR